MNQVNANAQVTDPGFGSGNTQLNVTSGNTLYVNETRAKVTGITSGLIRNIEYENLENGPFDASAWFLVIKTHYNPGKFKPQ